MTMLWLKISLESSKQSVSTDTSRKLLRKPTNKMINDYIYFYNHERIQLKIGRLPEVGFNVVRVCQQGLEGKMAGVIELVTGSFLQKSVDDLQFFHLFVGAQHCLMGGQQAVWNRFTTIMGRMTRPYSWGLNGPRSISATFQIMAAFSAMLAPTAVILPFGIRCSLFFVIGGHPDFTTMGVP